MLGVTRRASKKRASSPAQGAIAPLGRDIEAGVPGGWNEVAEVEEMRRDFAALAAEERSERKAWGIDTDVAAYGPPVDVPQRLKTV